jgi:hypothetical protein
MGSNEKVERELCFWIDCLVEETRSMYRGSATDSKRIDRMVRDASLRDSILAHVRQLVKLRIMSELFEDQGREKSYRAEVTVSPEGFSVELR